MCKFKLKATKYKLNFVRWINSNANHSNETQNGIFEIPKQKFYSEIEFLSLFLFAKMFCSADDQECTR